MWLHQQSRSLNWGKYFMDSNDNRKQINQKVLKIFDLCFWLMVIGLHTGKAITIIYGNEKKEFTQ